MDYCVFPNEPLSGGFLRNRLFGESEVSVPSDVIVVVLSFYHTCCFFSLLSTDHIPLDNKLLGFLSSSNTDDDFHRLSNYSAYTDNFLQCTLIKLF